MTVPALGLFSLYHTTHDSLILDDMAVCVLPQSVLGIVSLLLFEAKINLTLLFLGTGDK